MSGGGGPWAHQEAAAPPQQGVPVGWKSPIPYLFGGLAAMLGLIAFALLILACSYWKLSGYQDDNNNNNDDHSGKSGEGPEKEMKDSVVGNSILVIMAGHLNPTFLATPSSFGDGSTYRSSCTCSCSGGGGGGGGEGEKMGGGGDSGVVVVVE